MSTRAETIQYLLSQLEPLDVRSRAMFGEHALYLGEKLVALICNDTLFLKPTDAAAGYAEHLTPAPPYPGASDYLAVGADLVEDPERLQALVVASAELLPPPKPKRARAGR